MCSSSKQSLPARTSSQSLPFLSQLSVNLPAERNNWLDRRLACVDFFVAKFGANLTSDQSQQKSSFYVMNGNTHYQLQLATKELHSMFISATEHVLRTPLLWKTFDFPEAYWERAKKSFEQGDKTISGRLDFSMTPEHGIKCFEYNADSASCLFECGHTQGAWAEAVGLGNTGVNAGAPTASHLAAAWRGLGLQKGTLVHFLHDLDDEEHYHTLYMMSMAEKAGLECMSVESIEGFSFDENGRVRDNQNRLVTHVWKTWSYTTLFSQWKGEVLRTKGEVRLVDVCLNDKIVVYEPIWTAIPANKAILPVLCSLYPKHPLLLDCAWNLTDDLRRKGYARKPVSGRAGENISVHQPGSAVAHEHTGGRFGNNSEIFQELATLPECNGEYVQANTFVIGGNYAGTVLRAGSLIIGYESNAKVLRILDDGSPLPTSEILDIDGEEAPGTKAPFGAIMGYAPGGVPAYSCDYDTANKAVYPTRAFYRHQMGELYYGMKYQCVEFARRWMIHALGLTFQDVQVAHQIFPLESAFCLRNLKPVAWTTYENGSSVLPCPGALLIWEAGGEFRITGHVAVVVEATSKYVRVAEQNFGDVFWPKGQRWARELPVTFDDTTKTYTVHHAGEIILGWKNLPKDFVADPLAAIELL